MPSKGTPQSPGPAAEFRCGPTRVAIWKNSTENGDHFYRTTIEYTYRLPENQRDGQDDPGFRSTGSLPVESAIVARELLGRAIDWQMADQGQSGK